jgi:hypothetical protein
MKHQVIIFPLLFFYIVDWMLITRQPFKGLGLQSGFSQFNKVL